MTLMSAWSGAWAPRVVGRTQRAQLQARDFVLCLLQGRRWRSLNTEGGLRSHTRDEQGPQPCQNLRSARRPFRERHLLLFVTDTFD